MNKILVIFIIGFFLLLSCDISKDLKLGEGKEDLPDEMADSILVVTKNGDRVENILKAAYMKRFYDSKKTILDSLHSEAFNQKGQLDYEIDCNNAVINEAKNLMIAKGNVVVNSEKGKLKTSELRWDQNENIIYVDTLFTLIRKDNILTGNYLKTDLEFNNIDMKKVKGKGKIDKKSIDW